MCIYVRVDSLELVTHVMEPALSMLLKFAFLQVMILFYCLDLVSNKLFLIMDKKVMRWGLPYMGTPCGGVRRHAVNNVDSGTQVSSKS